MLSTTKPESDHSERNAGIDLLRILAMLFVVTLHVCGQGGLIGGVKEGSVMYAVVWLFECFSYPAVDLFALISGYVGGIQDSGSHVGEIVEYWLRVLFYTVIITVAFAVFSPGSVSGEQWLSAFLPITHQQYWYMTAFFGLLVLKPLLNKAILAMSRKDALWFSSLSLVLFMILPTAFSKSVYGLSGGYSAIWLVILYIVGGILRKEEFVRKVKWYVSLSAAILFSALTYGAKMIGLGGLVKYTSPTVFLSAVGYLLLFSQFRIRKFRKVFCFFSKASLSCYLIHVHPLIWESVMHHFAVHLLEGGWAVTAAGILGYAVLIFTVTSVFDFPRQWLFGKIRLKEKVKKLETKAFQFRYNR